MVLLVSRLPLFRIYAPNLFLHHADDRRDRAPPENGPAFRNGFGNFAGVLASWLTGRIRRSYRPILRRVSSGRLFRDVQRTELRVRSRTDREIIGAVRLKHKP